MSRSQSRSRRTGCFRADGSVERPRSRRVSSSRSRRSRRSRATSAGSSRLRRQRDNTPVRADRPGERRDRVERGQQRDVHPRHRGGADRAELPVDEPLRSVPGRGAGDQQPRRARGSSAMSCAAESQGIAITDEARCPVAGPGDGAGPRCLKTMAGGGVATDVGTAPGRIEAPHREGPSRFRSPKEAPGRHPDATPTPSPTPQSGISVAFLQDAFASTAWERRPSRERGPDHLDSPNG